VNDRRRRPLGGNEERLLFALGFRDDAHPGTLEEIPEWIRRSPATTNRTALITELLPSRRHT